MGDNVRRRVDRPFRFILVAAGLCLTFIATPAGAQSTAEGRAQAQKAGQLAAKGKCAPAVAAYTRAFDILGDPAILFNRAECLRKLGRAEPALADYERFLVELPNPPNKALVEQRITNLRKRLGMPPRTAPSAGAVAKPAPAVEPKPMSAPAASSATIIDDEDDELVAPAPAPVPAWKPPGASDDAALSAGLGDDPPGDDDSGVSPWVWVGLGAVVVAAGVVAGVLILGNNNTDIPESRLGNYKF